MKTMYSIIMATAFTFFASAVGIQAQTDRDSIYSGTMNKALAQLDSAHSVQQWLQVKNHFERISLKYTGEWLPLYYSAYCGVMGAFFDPKSDKNEALLEDATERIDRLYDFPLADQSEVNTLKAYCLTAKIATGPSSNGQKYFAGVIGLYEKAMEENPENPRPVILLSDFEERIPAFLRSEKRNRDNELTKARSLFDKEAPNNEKPYWGRYFLP